MREAPALTLSGELLAAGARVQAYDPVAMPETRRVLGEQPGLTLSADAYAALAGADALAIVTEWREFRSPDFERIKASLTQPAIFDGRNIYSPELMASLGFNYYGVGRGLAPAAIGLEWPPHERAIRPHPPADHRPAADRRHRHPRHLDFLRPPAG